jgi:hypothetical protein
VYYLSGGATEEVVQGCLDVDGSPPLSLKKQVESSVYEGYECYEKFPVILEDIRTKISFFQVHL